MFDKLNEVLEKYNELTSRLSDSDVVSDIKVYQQLSKEHAELKPIVENILNIKT